MSLSSHRQRKRRAPTLTGVNLMKVVTTNINNKSQSNMSTVAALRAKALSHIALYRKTALFTHLIHLFKLLSENKLFKVRAQR